MKATLGDDYLKITIEKIEVVEVVNGEVGTIINNIAKRITTVVIIVVKVVNMMTTEICTIKREIAQSIGTINTTILVVN